MYVQLQFKYIRDRRYENGTYSFLNLRLPFFLFLISRYSKGTKVKAAVSEIIISAISLEIFLYQLCSI